MTRPGAGGLALAIAVTAALVASPTAAGAQQAGRGLDRACPAALPAAGFADVAGNVHETAIDCLSFYDITRGTTPTTYDPARTVRRDQMATFTLRLLAVAGVDPPADAPLRFSDVPADSPHAQAIAGLAALDVVGGYPDGTYRPAARVRRDQMAAYLARVFSEVADQPLPSGWPHFEDTAGSAHEADVDAIAAAGVATGFDDGTYRPAAPVRRDQMASFVMRLADVLAEYDLLFTSLFVVTLDGYLVVDDSDPSAPLFGRGDPDALGHAVLRLQAVTGRLCYELALEADGPFVGSAIHRGAMDANGPAVIDLAAPHEETGAAEGCGFVGEDRLEEIEADPGGFYVSVRTDAFAAGAARGQVGTAHRAVPLSGAFVVDDSGEGFRFGQGQIDAGGVAVLQIDAAGGRLCAYVTTDAVGPYGPVRVHRAAMPANGPAVIELKPPGAGSGQSSDCVDVDRGLLAELRADSESFAVVVHGTDAPFGVVRSQVDSGTLGVPLAGENVVDDDGQAGRGEAGASGTAWLQAGFESGMVCYWLTTDATAPFTDAAIHRGARDEPGQAVVALEPPDDATGEVSACQHVDVRLLAETADVDNFFVQIATQAHPGGAVRGQLRDGLLF